MNSRPTRLLLGLDDDSYRLDERITMHLKNIAACTRHEEIGRPLSAAFELVLMVSPRFGGQLENVGRPGALSTKQDLAGRARPITNRQLTTILRRADPKYPNDLPPVLMGSTLQVDTTGRQIDWTRSARSRHPRKHQYRTNTTGATRR